MFSRTTLRRVLIASGLAAVAIATWFLAVDFSWFVESCPDCLCDRSALEWRVLGYPVRQSIVTEPNLIEQVATDLGVPCSHPSLQRWHKHRWWGLCICACPCHNGIVGLTGDPDWYDPRLSSKVRGLTASEPGLPQEFRQRVLIEHDKQYWLAFRDRLRALKEEQD
jgi:hypothetical protein